MAVLLDLEGQIIIPFLIFLLITSKYKKKHHIKKSDEFIHCNIIEVQKIAKIAKNGYFLALQDQIVTLFSRYFANDF